MKDPKYVAQLENVVKQMLNPLKDIQNISTTQRSFYFSPSDDFKVIFDTHHFILSYEMFVSRINAYKCKHYKILSLNSLSLDVKYEFNSDNQRMYSGKDGTVILADGIIEY